LAKRGTALEKGADGSYKTRRKAMRQQWQLASGLTGSHKESRVTTQALSS